MKHVKLYLGLAAGAITALGLFAMSGPGTAIAQGPFDGILAFITNDTENPVPVVNAGRQPYQSSFAVSTGSTISDCDRVEIPDGMTLTVNTVGVSAETTGTGIPDVYVFVGSEADGLGFRFSGELHPVRGFHEGIYDLTAFAGPVGQGGSYIVDICVGPSSGGSAISQARGIVTGYLEPAGVFDEDALP